MSDNARFDTHARTAHAGSLEALSPRVRAQLQQRRRAAFTADAARTTSAPPAMHRRHGWAWLGAPALALALAFAAPWRTAHDPAPVLPAVASAVAANAAPTTLEQDPDFYLWLASSDAVALASE